jgi:carboxyl-terminal processing protease
MIGYIRIGPIEMGTNEVVGGMLAELTKRGCRGLVLDLRWCPGGYVNPGVETAALFLKPGSVVSDLHYRNPPAGATAGKYVVPPTAGRFADLPLAVLISPETGGGGEMIASALRHHDPEGKRVVFVGQRTAGRGGVMSTRATGFLDLQYRYTTGTSLRPDGTSRHKTPESGPADDWGVRPTPGLEVPLTPDAVAELRRQAELHALRPAESREALPFDDPAADPHRLAALAHLRKTLGPPKEK